jgi:tyrosyl-tRNA synthetase
VIISKSKILAGTGDPVGIRNPPPDVMVLAQDRTCEIAVPVRVDKLLVEAMLAESASDGGRKIKQKSVEIDGELVEKPKLAIPEPARLIVVRVGRSMKRVVIG